MATWSGCFTTAVPNAQDVATFKCLEPLFQNIVRGVTSLVGVALFVMLVVGGFNFILAGGDQKKLEKARGTLTAAIGGVVVIVAAYLILLTIKTITGVDVTKFTVPTK